ncbi:hypothetical protein [uncultured Flavobacterium sp.]|uniref:hypothetical protein n=1 Tax=uncultured Flavobacterium sp. TaxID=165435 RepID=UPI0025F33E79|nr:hypothetical protein [uncultured Flavobacterium sp.]
MYKLAFLFLSAAALAQPPKMELKPNGFDPIEVSIPATPNEKLIEITKAWAQEFNRREEGADITEVTLSSLTVSANKRNGFFYRNRGEAHEHKIRYSMKIAFYENRYTLAFTVNDIYADGDKLIDYKLPDYFTSAGKLKEGYTDLKPSLERTVNDIAASHYNFIINFR